MSANDAVNTLGGPFAVLVEQAVGDEGLHDHAVLLAAACLTVAQAVRQAVVIPGIVTLGLFACAAGSLLSGTGRGRVTAVLTTAPTECERVGDQRAELGSSFADASTRLRRSTKSLVVSFSTR